jgi:hypothetical protein
VSFLLMLEMDKLEAILELLPKYEQKVLDAEPIFKLDNKRLEEIMRTLPHHQASYDQAYQEMKALEEWLNTVKDKVTARFWKKYIEGYPKALATRDVQAYIAGEKEIVELNQITIEVTLIKNHLSSIVESLKQLGWMMGHVTKLRIAEMQDAAF